MKKFRFLIVAFLSLCIMQGAWAIAPGGTLGGGGKSALPHPANEGKTVVEPTTFATPAADAILDESSTEIQIVKKDDQAKKTTIGKKPSQGESNNGFDHEEFESAVLAYAAEKQLRREIKDAIAQYRLMNPVEEPTAPMDGSLMWLVLLPMLLPPLTVYLKMGGITSEFWMSVLLTPMLLVPGIAYALYVVLTN